MKWFQEKMVCGGSCKTFHGMGVSPMKHGQDARATPASKGFCKSLHNHSSLADAQPAAAAANIAARVVLPS